MATLFPSLVGGLLPRLGQQPSFNDGFRNWIVAGHYSIQPMVTAGTIQLDITNLENLVRHIAFDFERFSFSSGESFSVVDLERQANNFAAWPLLKLYYSSFFAAHAIMRSQGAGVTLLSNQQVRYVNSIINSIYPNANNLTAGMYFYKTNPTSVSGVPCISLQQIQQAGGVHESFWKIFCQFLSDNASHAVASGAANSSDYVTGVDALCRSVLDGGVGGGAWISSMRNQINYHHKHNTWYPLRKNAKAINALTFVTTTDSKIIRLDHSKQKEPILAFTNMCNYLACLNIEVSEYLAARSTASRAFGQNWRRLSKSL